MTARPPAKSTRTGKADRRVGVRSPRDSKFTLRLPHDLHIALAGLATSDRRSTADYVVLALEGVVEGARRAKRAGAGR